nr:diacylglycerol kinase [Desulfobulbaceae bacterium]
MDCKPKAKTGIHRVWAAFFYSLSGLRTAFFGEAAFRQEAVLTAISLVVLCLLPLSPLWKGLIFFATASVLVVELLNSAIEAVVDLASPEYHVLAKQAKDIGSAAVFVSIAIAMTLWVSAIVTIFLS